jgi:transcriptional regulator with XRE-family HTH domain
MAHSSGRGETGEDGLTEPPKDFAQQLRSLREAQGLSVRDLADLVGVSKVTIWKWEKGESEPRTRMILPLAKALDVTPARLGSPQNSVSDQTAIQATALQRQPTEPAGSGEAEPLADVIARAKQMIADASGVGPKNITISIEY